eukprot:m.67755 g.67755  ORF g.67755 m.67755 type:complete len:197 (+) comp11913_c0_seq1:1367-1957(+)
MAAINVGRSLRKVHVSALHVTIHHEQCRIQGDTAMFKRRPRSLQLMLSVWRGREKVSLSRIVRMPPAKTLLDGPSVDDMLKAVLSILEKMDTCLPCAMLGVAGTDFIPLETNQSSIKDFFKKGSGSQTQMMNKRKSDSSGDLMGSKHKKGSKVKVGSGTLMSFLKSKEDKTEWSCTRCTLINKPGSQECELCRFPR